MKVRAAVLAVLASAALSFAATQASADGRRGGVKDYDRPFSWTGFYVGAAVGVGIGSTDIESELDIGLKGAQGIVSVGYDRQLNDRVVVGLFADYAFGDVDGNLGELNLAISNQWGIGGRLGFLVTQSSLWYATAGWTRADFDLSAGGDSIGDSIDGFFIGGGVEQVLSRNVSLKLEYRFSSYDDVNIDGGKFENDVHSVRLGFNYKFQH
jgi:outer membrane immunogenic protein